MKYSVSDFTIEQKIKLLSGQDFWHTEDFNGKIYKVRVSDGPVGLRMPVQNEKGEWYDKPSVAYPSTQVLSQTWETELAYKTGECIADDCIENGVDVILAPGLNIKRNPLCGRNFEYVSEDPFVAGVFGREYVKGVQAHHVGTTIKHYCANNQELSRWWVSSEVDERTLREIYLEPFRIAEEGKPWAAMCAYNLVNGVRMSEHSKLYKILREEFGHGDNLIMSDWDAVQDHVASVKAGLDLEMPYLEKGYKRLKEGYENGEITEEEIDICVKRVLAFIELCESESKLRKVNTTVEQRLQSSQKVAERGIVLLKNNGLLPLKENANISVAGVGASNYISGNGSSKVQPISGTPVTLVSALEQIFVNGSVSFKDINANYEQVYAAVNNAYGKDASIVCVNQIDSEGGDRQSLKLDRKQEMLIKETAKKNPNTVVILYCGAPIDMTEWIDDVSAVIWAGYPGELGANALANIISGKVNPSGKLTESFPLTTEDSIAEHTYSDFMKSEYSEGLRVGYRFYDEQDENGLSTLFPFGHGLSYSKFEYSNLQLEKTEDGVKVAFEIENISNLDGAEIAQIYVREVHSEVYRPFKELKGFKKVDIIAGEKQRIEVVLPMRAFEYYSVALDKWTYRPGKFEILVGASSQDILLKQYIEIK